MELRQLKYFEALASTLNFSRAAELLHVAQPALSRQVQQLEVELGAQLVDRSTRPLKLTNAGAFFHEQSAQVLARLQEIKTATRRLGDGSKRWVGIGFAPSVLYTFLPKVLHQFSVENAHLDIALSELTSVQQAEALKAGRIDLGFSRVPIPDPAIHNILLSEERLVLAVPAPSALAQEQSISIKRVVDEVLILYPMAPRPSLADQILHQFSVRGIEVGRTYETNGLQTAVGLVAAGVGVTFLPESVQRLSRSDVAYITLSDAGVTTPLIMATRRGDTTSHLGDFRTAIDKAIAC
ncbi:LysR family transcriptional regulator [Noviherbaspirillum sedimenti]|uniref:LysR family transcriptional regulator n=1 Tax=Noviherbaspirillum sedimenti TaxID=2320865 RepID=A0A3A3FXV1_9BURK|nr:LysR family transcriptional regulator [Noviherbaspirillum sedimenti]RJG01038.1 LysR family transcriptional regulator [Noviherbaspirillum sedimenti]